MTAVALQEIRCECGRCLFKARGNAEIEVKCARCNRIVRVLVKGGVEIRQQLAHA